MGYNMWMATHGGYDYQPNAFKPMDPRFHPLAQPGNASHMHNKVPFARFMYKIHPRIRVPALILTYFGLTRALLTWIYPYGPRDENNCRIPYDDKPYIRAFIAHKMDTGVNAYYARHCYKEIQDLRMAEARRQGLVE